MSSGYRVVVIDDDADLRALIKLTLEFTAGWEVTVAADGEEGIEAVRSLKPDAVVVDVMMPGIDGYEVCRRLKNDPDTAAIPRVFLTARREVDATQVTELGALGVIVKPFDPETLAGELQVLLEGRAE